MNNKYIDNRISKSNIYQHKFIKMNSQWKTIAHGKNIKGSQNYTLNQQNICVSNQFAILNKIDEKKKSKLLKFRAFALRKPSS